MSWQLAVFWFRHQRISLFCRKELAMSQLAVSAPSTSLDTHHIARYAVPVGRVLFAILFVTSGIGHFSQATIAYGAASGVPFASFLIPASGALAIAGALSIALGYRARLGALALIAFLVPVTLTMHQFWNAPDAMTAMMQKVSFLKNTSLVGAALWMAYFGAGPVSLDARRA
jgi:putative oxidoreductase